MELLEALRARRSIRGFKPEPVPEDVIREVFSQAQLAPSNCNTQPWRVDIVSGEKRDKLEQLMVGAAMSGDRGSPQFQDGTSALDGVYKERQWACALGMYGTLGIAREDKMARNIQMLQNFRFFSAPHGAFISMPLNMGPTNAVDVGIYLQTLMLLMAAKGIGCCAQGALAYYPDQVRQVVDLPEDHGILVGLSFGYPEPDAKVNEVTMDRVALEDSVHFA